MGDRLPPEPKLARQLGVSRATLREAMRAFEKRGLITRRQGRGTFLNAPRLVIESGLEVLESLEALTSRMGVTCITHDLEIIESPADAELASCLGVPEATPVVIVSRTKISDGHRLAYMYDVVPTSVISLAEMRASFAGSVLDVLIARSKPLVAYAWTNITSLGASKALAVRLDVRPGTALLLLEETVHAADDSVVNYSRNYFVPEFFSFHVIRRIPVDRRSQAREVA